MRECTTFNALLKPLTENLLGEALRRYNSDYYSKTFGTREHLTVMLYAQLHGLTSLRDIEIAFNGQKDLHTSGNAIVIKRSTLSDANARRPADCFLWIAEQLMKLLPRKQQKEVGKVVKKLDSSPIQLKGRGYDVWTRDNRTLRCQGMKLHIEYDGQLEMPTRARLSHANIDDCSVGKNWPILAGTVYVFDKGYYDFNWWWSIEQKEAFFVTRLKNNAAITLMESRPTHEGDILEDSRFVLKNKRPRGGKRNLYTKPLRRVVVARPGKTPLILVSNLMELPAETIAALYKERWEIELFFKWIKQNLKIKKFLGTSENAVKTQIAIALIVYLLMGIFKLSVGSMMSFHQLLVWIRHNWALKKEHYRNIKPPEYSFDKLKFCFNKGGY